MNLLSLSNTWSSRCESKSQGSTSLTALVSMATQVASAGLTCRQIHVWMQIKKKKKGSSNPPRRLMRLQTDSLPQRGGAKRERERNWVTSDTADIVVPTLESSLRHCAAQNSCGRNRAARVGLVSKLNANWNFRSAQFTASKLLDVSVKGLILQVFLIRVTL